MKKLIVIFFWLVLFAGSSVAENVTNAPIKIGDIGAYSKEALAVRAYKNAVNMAVKEINGKGGINGRPLEIVSRDSKGDPGEAVKLADELLTREHVSVLINWDYSNVTLAISNWSKQNKIPFIETGSEADSILWEQGNDYVFRTVWGGYMLMSGTLQKAYEIYGDKIKGKRWATIAPSFEFGQSLIKSTKSISAERKFNANWVSEQWPVIGKLDAGVMLQAIERDKPDVILCLLWTGDFIKFVREGNKRALFKDRIIIAPLAALPEHLEMLNADTPTGWISVGFPSEDIKDSGFAKFKQEYEESYHETPKTYSLSGYNGIYAIAAALKKTGTDDPAKIRDALETVSFQTPFGEQHFRKIDHQATTVFWVGETGVENGKGKLLNWRMENVVDHLPSDAWILEQRTKGKKSE